MMELDRVIDMKNQSVKVRLYGWAEKLGTPVLSKLFGEMVLRAVPLIRQYHSDLYHDANWLTVNVEGPTTLYFKAHDYGTHLSTDGQFWSYNGKGTTWRVELTNESGEWFATFTVVTDPVA